MLHTSPGNEFMVTSWEWWQYEIACRLAQYADRAAVLGAKGEFGVYADDMPTPEGGPCVKSGVLSGAFRLVRVPRPDWLSVTVARWEETPGLWQFGEHCVLGGVGEGLRLSETLDPLTRRAVNRLAVEADGLRVRARAGFQIHAGVVTLGLKIDALLPAGTWEVGDV